MLHMFLYAILIIGMIALFCVAGSYFESNSFNGGVIVLFAGCITLFLVILGSLFLINLLTK